MFLALSVSLRPFRERISWWSLGNWLMPYNTAFNNSDLSENWYLGPEWEADFLAGINRAQDWGWGYFVLLLAVFRLNVIP